MATRNRRSQHLNGEFDNTVTVVTTDSIRIRNHLVRDHPKLIHLLARDLDACNVAVSD